MGGRGRGYVYVNEVLKPRNCLCMSIKLCTFAVGTTGFWCLRQRDAGVLLPISCDGVYLEKVCFKRVLSLA